MTGSATIHSRIVDRLYTEGLELADEVRAAFDMSARPEARLGSEDATRIALSCEALRTTTRMMHTVAWLLNYRAFFSGDISEFQLRRHARLNPDMPGADAERLPLLTPETRALIASTERFYERLVRLDAVWRKGENDSGNVVVHMHEQLDRAVGI